jgi:hypothetical protein
MRYIYVIIDLIVDGNYFSENGKVRLMEYLNKI